MNGDTHLIARAATSISFWKLAIWKLFNNSWKVAVVYYLGATTTERWTNMDGESRISILLGASVAVAALVDAFLDTTMAQLKAKLDAQNNTHQPPTTP